MQNTAAIVWGLIIAIVVIGGGYLLWITTQGTTTTVPINENVSDTATTSQTGGLNTTGTTTGITVGGSVQTAPMSVTVTYNGTRFLPQSVTIARGGTVTWRNESTGNMWVASAQHPTHTVYSGTARSEHCPDTANKTFDQCAPETDDFSFTFDKTGQWNYHDHTNSSAVGTIIVQ